MRLSSWPGRHLGIEVSRKSFRHVQLSFLVVSPVFATGSRLIYLLALQVLAKEFHRVLRPGTDQHGLVLSEPVT